MFGETKLLHFRRSGELYQGKWSQWREEREPFYLKEQDSYIPPLWIMCLESVAHLLVIFNVSANFLIYCSVSNQFKAALSKLCIFFCKRVPEGTEGISSLINILTLCPNLIRNPLSRKRFITLIIEYI